MSDTQEILKSAYTYGRDSGYLDGFIAGYKEGLEVAEAERKTGKWIFKRRWHEADECNCSLCNQLMTTFMGERKKYCPNCGADMRGEQSEAD